MLGELNSGHGPSQKAPEGCVDYCALFSDRLLVVSGWVHAGDPARVEFGLYAGPQRLELVGSEVVHGRRRDVSSHIKNYSREDWGFMLFATLRTTVPSSAALTLDVSDSNGRTQFPCPAVERGSHDSLLAAIEPYTDRQKAQAQGCLRKRLDVVRPLEESPPLPLEDLCEFVRANVDWATLLDGRKVFIQGWLLDAEDCVTSVQVRYAGARSANLLEQWSRKQRPDVVEAFPDYAAAGRDSGFVCLSELSPPLIDTGSAKPSLETAELLIRTARGQAATQRFTIAQRPHGSAFQVTSRFLETLALGDSSAFQILDRHVGPALESVWKAPAPVASRTLVEDYGSLPESPLWSLVVPLYGRYDFLRYQLAEFSRDPDLSRAEIIYVVDDPKILDAARGLARDLHPLFRTPFRLVFPGENLGFAGANNFGVSYASAPLLVLLNSDVLPSKAGWLSRLRDIYQRLETPGAVGPRLLFEDGTLQHDGIAFQSRSELPGFVLNDHPGKGLPPWLAPETPVEEVPAVTAACLMMDRQLYNELGGLDTGYILGDFEDSHLCLAARHAGRKNYLARSEALYHLERLSQSLAGTQDWRFRLTLYNAWRHTRKWGAELTRLAASEQAL